MWYEVKPGEQSEFQGERRLAQHDHQESSDTLRTGTQCPYIWQRREDRTLYSEAPVRTGMVSSRSVSAEISPSHERLPRTRTSEQHIAGSFGQDPHNVLLRLCGASLSPEGVPSRETFVDDGDA